MTTTAPGNGNGNGNKPAAAAAIEKRKPTGGELLHQEFQKWKPTLKALLPAHLDAERIIKMAMGAYLRSDLLQKCTLSSVVKATIMAAELGLEPGGLLGEAYLVPFNNTKKFRDGNVWKERKVMEATLIPGYKGLVKLARQTGDIASVYACLVDESEARTFSVALGTTRCIKHDMDLSSERSGKVFAAYAVVKFKDGSEHFEVMTKPEIDAIRARSKASEAGPWETDYGWMAKKTVLKQTLKLVTLSTDRPSLAVAAAADDAAEAGQAFNTELTAEFEVVEDSLSPPDDASPPQLQAAPTTMAVQGARTAELAAKLGGTPPHDPKTGELK